MIDRALPSATSRRSPRRVKAGPRAEAGVIRARGGAARLFQEAEGYKASVIARADGDARRFSHIASEYVKAPAVTREP